jgi:hypothetical protein
MYLECTPSYGRDYKSAKEVKEAYAAGKDFTIATFGRDMGRQINKQDAENDKGITALNIRYKRLTQVCVIKVAHPATV